MTIDRDRDNLQRDGTGTTGQPLRLLSRLSRCPALNFGMRDTG